MGEEYRPLDLSAAEAALPALAFYSDPDVGGYVISHGNSWYRGQAINELNVSTLLWLANVQATGGPLADARDAAEAYMNGILQNPGYVRIPYGQYRFATIGSVMSDDPEYIRWMWARAWTGQRFPFFGRTLCRFLNLPENHPQYGASGADDHTHAPLS